MQELICKGLEGNWGESNCREYLGRAFKENRKDISTIENWDWELQGSRRGRTRRYADRECMGREWMLNLVNKKTRSE